MRTHLSGKVAGPRRAQFGRRLFAPQVENQVHHPALDVVPHRAMLFVLEADGIVDLPLKNGARNRVRELLAAHVDDQMELNAAEMANTLREVISKIDALFVHRLERVGRDTAGGSEARASRNQNVAAVRSGKALGHLTAAGIPNTNKQDALQWAAHNFSRKYRCTR